MSRTEHYRGTLKEIKPSQMRTIQEIAKDLMDEHGVEMDDYDKKYNKDNYVYVLCCERYDKFVASEGKLYEIIVQKEIGVDEDIAEATLNKDGTISYEVKYYNGVTGFDEMIDHALRKLKNE